MHSRPQQAVNCSFPTHYVAIHIQLCIIVDDDDDDDDVEKEASRAAVSWWTLDVIMIVYIERTRGCKLQSGTCNYTMYSILDRGTFG